MAGCTDRPFLPNHADALAPGEAAALASTEARLTDIARRTLRAEAVDTLRGLEGEAAYFAVFSTLVRVDDPAFRFGLRTRRPPLDRRS